MQGVTSVQPYSILNSDSTAAPGSTSIPSESTSGLRFIAPNQTNTHGHWIEQFVTENNQIENRSRGCWTFCINRPKPSILTHIMQIGGRNREVTSLKDAMLSHAGQSFIATCLASDHRKTLLCVLLNEIGSQDTVINELVQGIQQNAQAETRDRCEALTDIALQPQNPTAATEALTALQTIARQTQNPTAATEALTALQTIALQPQNPTTTTAALTALQTIALQTQNTTTTTAALTALQTIALQPQNPTAATEALTALQTIALQTQNPTAATAALTALQTIALQTQTPTAATAAIQCLEQHVKKSQYVTENEGLPGLTCLQQLLTQTNHHQARRQVIQALGNIVTGLTIKEAKKRNEALALLEQAGKMETPAICEAAITQLSTIAKTSLNPTISEAAIGRIYAISINPSNQSATTLAVSALIEISNQPNNQHSINTLNMLLKSASLEDCRPIIDVLKPLTIPRSLNTFEKIALIVTDHQVFSAVITALTEIALTNPYCDAVNSLRDIATNLIPQLSSTATPNPLSNIKLEEAIEALITIANTTRNDHAKKTATNMLAPLPALLTSANHAIPSHHDHAPNEQNGIPESKHLAWCAKIWGVIATHSDHMRDITSALTGLIKMAKQPRNGANVYADAAITHLIVFAQLEKAQSENHDMINWLIEFARLPIPQLATEALSTLKKIGCQYPETTRYFAQDIADIFNQTNEYTTRSTCIHILTEIATQETTPIDIKNQIGELLQQIRQKIDRNSVAIEVSSTYASLTNV